MTGIDRELTEDDKRAAFIQSTTGFANAPERWKQRAATGLTDEQLAEALRFEIGIFGGASGPDRMATAHQGAGLKIWASWNGWIDTGKEKPIFAGDATVRMAREVFGINDPEDGQMRLL